MDLEPLKKLDMEAERVLGIWGSSVNPTSSVKLLSIELSDSTEGEGVAFFTEVFSEADDAGVLVTTNAWLAVGWGEDILVITDKRVGVLVGDGVGVLVGIGEGVDLPSVEGVGVTVGVNVGSGVGAGVGVDIKSGVGFGVDPNP